MNLKNILTAALLACIACAPMAAQKNNSQHSDAHSRLLANAAKGKDQIRLVEKNTFIDLIDDIEPEPDLYTEGWNSKRVNPFKESEVPNMAVIDVTGYAMPASSNRVTSNYGYRAKFGRMHKGIDIGIRNNDTIYAAFDGKVRLTSYEAKGYGNYVIIRHPNDLETVYGHLNRALVKPDQIVKAGQPIGLGGSTGRSTGPHLHFETRYMGYAINPAAIFDFANRTTHTDEYTFTKQTYTQARNYAPSRGEQASSHESSASSREQASSSSRSSKKASASYTVKKGDSLSKIAKKNGVTVSALRRINGLTAKSTIKPGQTIRLR